MRTPTPLLAVALGGLTLPLLALQEDERPERYLRDRDLNRVANALQEWIQAKLETKDVNEAEAELREQVDKLERKLEDTPAQGDLLASPADLGRAIWLSYDYDRNRKPKQGELEEMEYVDGQAFTKDAPLEYVVWTPNKYRPRDNAYPVILSIPDADVRPFDHVTEEWVDGDIRDGAIIASPVMPEDTTLWEEMDGLARVMLLYKDITYNWAVDFDRIYLAGRGRGVETAVRIASAFPDRFAGVVGRAGDVGSTRPDNFGNLSTYFAGGGAEARTFAEAAEELGYDNVTLQPEGRESDLWKWIQEHPRVSYPTEIHLVAGPRTNRLYWLQVPQTDGSTLVEVHAKVDRSSNTVTVEGDGVTEFTLHFSDAVLDLSKEVTVIANGQESKDLIARSFHTVLDNVYNGRIDPGKVLVGFKTYHLPSVELEGEEGQ